MRSDPIATFMDSAERLLRRHRLKPRGAACEPGRYEVLFLHRHQAEQAAEVLAPVIPDAAVRHSGRYWRAGGSLTPIQG